MQTIETPKPETGGDPNQLSKDITHKIRRQSPQKCIAESKLYYNIKACMLAGKHELN